MDRWKQSLYKVWDILSPLIIYYCVYSVIYLLLAYLLNTSLEYGGDHFHAKVMEHAATVTGTVNGLCMLLGIVPLVPALYRMITAGKVDRAEVNDISTGNLTKEMKTVKVLGKNSKKVSVATGGQYALVLLIAISAAVGLNMLVGLVGLAEMSDSYKQVADKQYGVAFGIGLVLYGMVTPLVEEVIFRGMIYNRMKQHFSVILSIILSGVLFGAYHGNWVQAFYGGIMGVLMAYVYEKVKCFIAPVLFHSSANLVIYYLSFSAILQQIMQKAGKFSFVICAGLLIVAMTGAFCLRETAKQV